MPRHSADRAGALLRESAKPRLRKNIVVPQIQEDRHILQNRPENQDTTIFKVFNNIKHNYQKICLHSD
jgi:hypothetical protein